MHIDRCKYLTEFILLEKGDAENLQDFAEAPVELEFFLEGGHEHVDTDGDPDLDLHRVGGSPIERLDPQVLFDPLEEQFDLPATLVELGDGQSRKSEVVGEKDEALAGLGIDVADAPEGSRILLRCLGAGQHDRLVAAEPGRLVDGPRTRGGRTRDCAWRAR